MADRVLAEGTQLLQEETVPSLLGETTWRERPGVVERVRAIVRSVPAPAVAWAQRAMAARPDSTQTLRDADLPALVVAGAEDVLTPPEECEAMARLLPDARFVRHSPGGPPHGAGGAGVVHRGGHRFPASGWRVRPAPVRRRGGDVRRLPRACSAGCCCARPARPAAVGRLRRRHLPGSACTGATATPTSAPRSPCPSTTPPRPARPSTSRSFARRRATKTTGSDRC